MPFRTGYGAFDSGAGTPAATPFYGVYFRSFRGDSSSKKIQRKTDPGTSFRKSDELRTVAGDQHRPRRDSDLPGIRNVNDCRGVVDVDGADCAVPVLFPAYSFRKSSGRIPLTSCVLRDPFTARSASRSAPAAGCPPFCILRALCWLCSPAPP